ncbi:hypothetical protein [Haloarchaeobius sp. DFWS5]|uniref:hypothetical protein n=1 Tax=Haloarchaeobius sp. DFWS5 TaxID=3446114 RepID=UPI003EBA4356
MADHLFDRLWRRFEQSQFLVAVGILAVLVGSVAAEFFIAATGPLVGGAGGVLVAAVVLLVGIRAVKTF